jgi:hypothetical protein
MLRLKNDETNTLTSFAPMGAGKVFIEEVSNGKLGIQVKVPAEDAYEMFQGRIENGAIPISGFNKGSRYPQRN